MNSLKLGVASVTFRSKTISEVIEIAKKSGVTYIEWGSDVHVKTEEDAKTARQLCDENNIKISSYGSYFRAGLHDTGSWEQICKNAQIMGAESIRIWLGDKDREKFMADEYNKLLKDLSYLCDVAEKYNLLVCPECHDNTFNNNTLSIIRLKNDLNKDNFRTYFQSRYFRFDYDIDRIEKTFNFIENVHVSYRDLAREQRFRKKDKKYLDKLINKLIEMNFDGIVMVEFTKGDKEKSFMKDVEKLRQF
ncbi:MAG: sugar phosphate isomerase/epimerase [Clostridia bacterium]|nr:sugar phosphate isomerase/epimerase [Clostridia bacterium]